MDFAKCVLRTLVQILRLLEGRVITMVTVSAIWGLGKYVPTMSAQAHGQTYRAVFILKIVVMADVETL
jgi:hypothetical protein